jgi:hypothetical protein
MGLPGIVALAPPLLVATLSYWPKPVLNPKTYRSADETFELDVDPSEPNGSGPAHYRLERDGVVVWEGAHPFTFFDAAVSGDGTIAGISYSRGLEGGRYGEDQGDLRLVVLDVRGAVRFESVLPRRESRVIHGDPVPQSKGLLIDEAGGRVLVRIVPDDSLEEDWWLYSLDTGGRLTRFDPRTLGNGYLADLRRLTEASRILAQWESDGQSRFGVLTRDLVPVWSHEVSHTADRAARIDSVSREGFTLEMNDAELVDFAVTTEAGVVAIRESGRRAAVPPPDPLKEAAQIELPLLGTIELGNESGKRSPIRSVNDFDIDGQGHFGFVRSEPGASSLVIVDNRGGVLADVALDFANSEMSGGLTAWLGGDTWVVAARAPKGDVARLQAVDVSTGETHPFADLEGAYLLSLRGMSGSGLSILHGLSDTLRVLDRNGVETARLRQDENDESALFSPEDMTALPNGGLAVLDNIRHEIQIFRGDGAHVENLDLETILGRRPNYPASIAASPDGGFAVWDFGAPRPLLLLGPGGGALLSELAPRYGDGRPATDLQSLRFAPDGGLWASDGASLVRLNDEGVVDLVLGERPAETRLTEVSATARDAEGNFYLLDRRTATVHVFSASGSFTHRLEPAPGDARGPSDSAQLSVAGDGTVFLSDGPDESHLVFDREGNRIDVRPATLDTIREEWFAEPRGVDRWVTTMEDLYLTDSEGRVLHRIRRHGDRTWLDSPSSAAVSSDGTVALLTGDRGLHDKGAKLGVFTVDGRPTLTRSFPNLDRFASIAFEGDRIVLGTESELFILDGAGELLGRFVPEAGYDRSRFSHFLTVDARELLVLDELRRVVYRYDLSALR